MVVAVECRGCRGCHLPAATLASACDPSPNDFTLPHQHGCQWAYLRMEGHGVWTDSWGCPVPACVWR